MSKVRLDNYRDCKDYWKIVAAVGKILARQQSVSPIEVFVETGTVVGGRCDEVETGWGAVS